MDCPQKKERKKPWKNCIKIVVFYLVWLNQEWIWPPENIWKSGDIFDCHTWRDGSYWHPIRRTQGYCWTSWNSRESLLQKSIIWPNMLKLRNSWFKACKIIILLLMSCRGPKEKEERKEKQVHLVLLVLLGLRDHQVTMAQRATRWVSLVPFQVASVSKPLWSFYRSEIMKLGPIAGETNF